MEQKYGLIGHPLGHSLSPWIHERLFALTGTTGTYRLLDLDETAFAAAKDTLSEYSGYNITIPYKTKIIETLDQLDDSARDCGAVNCVHVHSGRQTGYNTDRDGFLNSLPDGALSGRVLLVGCGGAGRMMAAETVRHGGGLTIAVRRESASKKLAVAGELEEKYADASVRVVAIDDCADDYDTLLNATPIGMYPNVDACPVTEDVIRRVKLVFDVIYNPVRTKLLLTADRLGIPAIDGAEMLVRQAARAQEIWRGVRFEEAQLCELTDQLRKKLEG